MLGISDVIAVTMILMITVALASLGYIFFSGTFLSLSNISQQSVNQTTSSLGVLLKVENINGNNITVRNIGQIAVSDFKLYVNDVPVNFIANPPILNSGGISTITADTGLVGNLKLTASSGAEVSIQSNVPAIYYFAKANESYQNGEVCSLDLYVMENEKIKFFVSVPPVNQIAPYGSGTYNCYASPLSLRNDFAGAPVKIWTKNSQSTIYRKNNTILDQTSFYASGLATFNFPDINKIFVSNNQLTYVGSTAANLEPSVVYTIEPNTNYVKIEFKTKNVGTGVVSVRLGWNGDHDPPAGTWRNDTGSTCAVSCTSSLITKKWIAFYPTSYNDLYGIIVSPDSTLQITSFDGPSLLQDTAINLNPGESRSMIFYLVSDFKGSPGNEWKPVEDTYNKLFT